MGHGIAQICVLIRVLGKLSEFFSGEVVFPKSVSEKANDLTQNSKSTRIC